MNKLMLTLALALFAGVSVHGEGFVMGPVNKSASGTTSATVFVEGGNAPVEVTQIATRFDAGVATGLVVVQSGDAQYQSTSATSATGSVVWFTNTGTAVAVGESIIIYDESLGDYYLRKVSAATTTSVTVYSTIAPALTLLDTIWSVDSNVEIPAGVTSQTGGLGRIWLPSGRPTALTVDGNTTACRIAVSGIRGSTK